MSIEFESGWDQHTVDHLTNEALARRLIRSASRALSQNNSIELIVWRNAANDGSHIPLVTKGLHQPEPGFPDLMHITMSLLIPGSKRGDRVYDTNFQGQFHLYTKILDPDSKRRCYGLQPIRLSYQTVGHRYNVDNSFVQTVINNADAISSDLASKA